MIVAAATMEWSLTSIIMGVTNIGFSVLVAWYLLSRAIPEMQKRFSDDLKQQREDNRESLKREKDTCSDLLKIVVRDDHDMIKRALEKIESMAVQLNDIARNMPTRRGQN